MRGLALAAALALLNAPAFASRAFVESSAAASSGSGFASDTAAGASFDKDRYLISARARVARLGAEGPGTREEFSARLARELYFVTVAGRLGTSAPNSQGASYRIAAGEAWFKFYGADLAPEHPELSPVIWESSGPVPDPAALDRTWITRVGGVYTNVDSHIQTGAGVYKLVEGAWQFSVSETYRERTTFGVQISGSRYSKSLDGTAPTYLSTAVDYWGNYLPVSGWPNNWQSIRVSRRWGDSLDVGVAGTRLNMVGLDAITMAAAEASWSVDDRWTLKAAFERSRRDGGTPRSALVFGASRRW